jgi:hypothetical protein
MGDMNEAQVTAFIDAMAAEIGALSGDGAEAHRREAVAEATALVAAIIAADGRCTDDELWAYIGTVGAAADPPLVTTPAQLRESDVLTGRADWVRAASTMFDLLVRADRRDGTTRSHRYYELALAAAHATAAVDRVPSSAELTAIDTFRSTLLGALDDAGVPRPGRRRAEPPARGRPGADAGAGSDAEPAAPAPVAVAGEGPVDRIVGPAEVPAEPLETLLAELDDLVGLTEVKAEIRRLTSLLQVQRLREERGLPTFETSHHLVFTGNPGTGKTTVARLLSRIYKSLGLVSKGHLVETDRSALVAGYVGQTALRTREALEHGLGGTLLIDEAYALARGGEHDFGREAIDTLVKFMEDHRNDLAVVVAGYPEEMAQFIATNPGLESRFTRTVNFADYSTDELVEIFAKLGEKSQYHPSDSALAAVRAMVASEPRDRGFGNARYVRNLFESTIAHQAARLAPLHDVSTEQLTTLTAADVVGP